MDKPGKIGKTAKRKKWVKTDRSGNTFEMNIQQVKQTNGHNWKTNNWMNTG